MRIRLLLALMFSAALVPVITGLPAVPVTVFDLVTVVIAEIMVGLFLGGLTRLLISAIHMGGMIIAYQSSLASAIVPDVTQTQGQGTSLSNLLGMVALVLLFATDLHHVMLRALADSYTLFTPGQIPMVGDMTEHALRTMSGAFRTAMQLASPHIVIGITLYLGSGIIARLMPNMQVFFILMPPQMILSFLVLMTATSAIMLWYINYFRDTIGGFVAP